MRQKFELVPAYGDVEKPTQAVFYEKAAAKYLSTNRLKFRELVFTGNIPWVTFPGEKRRRYLKRDLDLYLEALPKYTMLPSENSPTP